MMKIMCPPYRLESIVGLVILEFFFSCFDILVGARCDLFFDECSMLTNFVTV